MTVTMSGCGKSKRQSRLTYQRIDTPQTAAIDIEQIRIRYGKPRWAAGALLLLPAFAWAK